MIVGVYWMEGELRGGWFVMVWIVGSVGLYVTVRLRLRCIDWKGADSCVLTARAI